MTMELDILVLTETWLTNKEMDNNWCEMTDLNRGRRSLYTYNRSNGRGDGLGLTCKSHFKVTVLKKGHKPSFEYCTWGLTVKNKCLTITGIYHPPYSTRNRIKNRMFIDDFTEYATTLLSNNTNNIITGDFNLHISDAEDTDATIFTDTCKALGLYQHITFSTH